MYTNVTIQIIGGSMYSVQLLLPLHVRTRPFILQAQRQKKKKKRIFLIEIRGGTSPLTTKTFPSTTLSTTSSSFVPFVQYEVDGGSQMA